MPDLNSLPTSRPVTQPSSPLSQRPRRISISTTDAARPSPSSPRSPSLASLQAAAAINAGLHRSPSRASPGLERRRSSLMNNLTNINDDAVPAPGELQSSTGSSANSPRLGRRSFAMPTADPHHHRQPSLGEIHQELENEQEAQVNRLLHMIRLQQDQLASIQRQGPQDSPLSAMGRPMPSPPPPPSTLATPAGTVPTEHSSSRSGSLSQIHFNRPNSLSRQSTSRLSTAGTNSRGNSPGLRPQSGGLGPLTEDFLLGGTRDETSFYQAETQMLTRENQMLKLRIRELERQVAEISATGTLTIPLVHQSPLSSPPATFTSETAPPVPAEVDAVAKVE